MPAELPDLSEAAPRRLADSLLAVEAWDLGRRFGRRWALAGVSLRVSRGSTLLVAGRNGAGKSTLLRVLSTALRADCGTARVEGFDLRTQREEVRRRTALLAHAAFTYEALTALENLQVAAGFLGRDTGRQALGPLLAEVGLAERADDRVETFSAGMRRRLSLARTLLQDVPLVFLDEPYAELDAAGFALVDRLLARWRERGTTVVMATHMLERAAARCDEAIALEAGRVAWSGPPAELLRRTRMEAGPPGPGALPWR